MCSAWQCLAVWHSKKSHMEYVNAGRTHYFSLGEKQSVQIPLLRANPTAVRQVWLIPVQTPEFPSKTDVFNCITLVTQHKLPSWKADFRRNSNLEFNSTSNSSSHTLNIQLYFLTSNVELMKLWSQWQKSANERMRFISWWAFNRVTLKTGLYNAEYFGQLC